ncbi:MAG: phosphoribosylaminoimidazolesuccinocarboxamide synthase [Candidatus Neomarinimicrobiota bacterium]|nr:MAG: phosphoribosylaminoimidazolesuccinocarboxamide synthase [Candidatus Neomarinimicrobiota bacterium]
MKESYRQKIEQALDRCLVETDLPLGEKTVGKVRDSYDLGDRLILVTTDRQSAFDRILAAVPFKGQVLNLTSAWWFDQTKPEVPNHLISVPDPNVTVARKCDVFPIEFVVRGYITGSTSTSLWTVYQQGRREYCGLTFPDGLQKNQRLPQPVLTPTTKAADHDRPISPEEILAEGWMSPADWEQAADYAMTLFRIGTERAVEHGLILVDTKYEFGRAPDGTLCVVDEVHTPDSSRYWLADSYEARFHAGQEPENIDKEFLRLWFADHCDPYGDDPLPEAPRDLVVELSARYIDLFERITGQSFSFPESDIPIQERIHNHLQTER